MGSGSFASVYACIENATEMHVAIKVMKREYMKSRDKAKLLQMEIEVMFKLKPVTRSRVGGAESLCEIYKVYQDQKRVRITFLTFLDILSNGILWKPHS